MKKTKSAKKTARRPVKRAASARTSRLKAARGTVRRPVVRTAGRPRPARATKAVKAVKRKASRSVARMAARVIANRTASNAAKKAQPIVPAKAVVSYVPAARGPSKSRVHRPQGGRSSRQAGTTPGVNRQVVRMARVPQFTYMRAPGADGGFDVGDTVEVFCDHERESERVRGWIKGVVVQVDNKLVAVQFRSNVFLTDGWMVPDRILWYSLGSDQIRAASFGKKGSRKVVPDF